MEFYENLPEETKLFLNKAMDVYASVKDKKIEDFSELDKCILSLLVASLLADGDLKNFISKYDDIKLEKLLDFMEIKEDDIKPLEGDYKTFYDEYFKSILVSMELLNVEKKNYRKTPSVIFSYFNHILVVGSGILNAFANYCEFKSDIFSDHSIFHDLEQKLSLDKSMDENENNTLREIEERWREVYQNLDARPEGLNSRKVPFNRSERAQGSIADILPSRMRKEVEELKKDEDNGLLDSKEEERQKELEYWESEDLWTILDEVMAKFIGQEQAVEDIFYNIVNNQRMVLNGTLEDGERSVMFIDGPTGTGKTAIIREISKRLNIPFYRSSATKFSPTGYVGDNIESSLQHLLKEADRDIEKAERGIVVFDEFDKLVYNTQDGNSLDLKKAVQQQLLDFMGGGTYKVPIMQSFFGSMMGNFDTSKLTFICLGALTSLREDKSVEEKSAGFNANITPKKIENFEITPQDLIDFGYERELVGRLNTYLHTEEYQEEVLLRILKESAISPMKGFEKWVNSYNKRLVICDGVYEAIASEAYKLNTGARSLQTVMNNIRTVFLKKVMRSKDDEVYLDTDTVYLACKKAVTRKSR